MSPRVSRLSNHVEPHSFTAVARHYVGDLVYGANDGIITTFAVVAGVVGGALSPAAVLIVGAANLAADGLSMGVWNYLPIRAHESAREADHLSEEEASPLLPYMLTLSPLSRDVSCAILTLAALFGVGAARATVTAGRWWMTGVEMLGLGVLVAGAAYGAGALVSTVVGNGP